MNLLKKFWHYLTHEPETIRPAFKVFTKGQTIPEAFNYPEESFNKLVNELTFFIKPDDRIVTFSSYIDSSLFEQYKLDIKNPNHTAVLGYAFCLAIVLQHALVQKTVINDVLSTFARSKAEDLVDTFTT